MHDKAQARRFRSLMWIGGLIVIAVITIAVAASTVLYQHTVDLLTQNLRERLLSISITQAANISAENLAALQTEADWQKPEWTRVVSRLKKAKDSNPGIVYMYIFRKSAEDPSRMEFVADAESIDPYANLDDDPDNDVDANGDGIIDPEGADYLQWPGQPYDEAADIPETLLAYDGPLTAAELYEDSYGRVLTGYAPITDDQGNVVAILATDIKADDFLTVTQQTLYPFLAFIVFLTSIILILAIMLIHLWKRRADSFAELDRLKDEFLSVAAHQLRAPLTAMRGYASLIVEGNYGPVTEPLAEPLYRIMESGRNMANSIEDYLNVSRIEQNRMKYERSRFDLNHLAKTVADDLAPIATRRSIALSINTTDPVMVNADVGKIKQVMTNLADNAIKYTSHGSVILSVASTGNKARFMVTDTGTGIAPEELSKLFRKFSRARDANKVNTTGTGLGLYVARQLIEGHKGKIWAESDGIGKGSRFIFEIPA